MSRELRLKREANRASTVKRATSKKRLVPKGPRYIVGDDFLAILPAARRAYAAAIEPKKAGRPRKVTQ